MLSPREHAAFESIARRLIAEEEGGHTRGAGPAAITITAGVICLFAAFSQLNSVLFVTALALTTVGWLWLGVRVARSGR
jgi:hypothetical protein